jgi:carbon-monoxide dehydrogenase medium subunit
VIPVAFDYVRAGSIDEAIAVLSEHGDEAKLLAGGHSLLPLMKLRLATPSVLVDIGRLHELSYVRDQGDHVAVGALTRHYDVHNDAVAMIEVPLLATVAGRIGDPQVRHRGTIGGSLAHADPASDLPGAVLALGGTLVARGPDGEREIAAAEFFQGFLETVLAPDEVLVEIRLPKAPGGHSYQKFVRRSQDWAIVGVAVARVNGRVGVSLVNVASTPVRAMATEEALASGASAAEAAEQAGQGLEPSGDGNATPEFRRHLARVLTKRGLLEAGL